MRPSVPLLLNHGDKGSEQRGGRIGTRSKGGRLAKRLMNREILHPPFTFLYSVILQQIILPGGLNIMRGNGERHCNRANDRTVCTTLPPRVHYRLTKWSFCLD
ncbi:hypothetical protein CDAR_235981 [Caerostris darwini]|uniref:Uncharacterized protein n=1 Tax=Caerostris darwini TaxID=1538125 RepID=A0AAV4UFX6_9ARAC|nr:hypothetical protein CDAR_235981 [Caerostris darwini]